MSRQQRPSRGLALAVLMATVAIVAVPAEAVLGHGPDPTLGGPYPQNSVLGWTWMSGSSATPAWMKPAIEAGAGDVAESRGSKAPTFPRTSAGKGAVQYGTGVPCGIDGLACARRYLPDDFLIAFREQGHVFDWGSLRWCQYYSSPPDGCYDVENVTLDELGHVTGLNHHANYSDQRDYRDAVVQEMSRTKPKAGWNAHAFGVCDVATLQVEYGLILASTPISTCLDLPTVTALSPSKTSIPYAGSVTFNATLKVSTSSSYKRLSGQALSGRAISLQRRGVGQTAWTTVGALSPTTPTGTYTLTIAPGATADWRAVFTAPSAEGLRGSTSTTVRVTVAPCTIQPCPMLLASTEDPA